jgi:hypothetical protein
MGRYGSYPQGEQSTKVYFAINLRAAKAIGLTFLLTLLGRPDEVLECGWSLRLVAHRVVGRSSAFGELRLYEGHPLVKARSSA